MPVDPSTCVQLPEEVLLLSVEFITGATVGGEPMLLLYRELI